MRTPYMGDDDILTIPANGGPSLPLSDSDPQDNLEPSFSPNGKQLLWTRVDETDFDTDLILANADGTSPDNLTVPGVDNDFDGSWQSIQRCGGKRVTLVGDAGPDAIRGTRKADVIAGLAGKDRIIGRGGNDRLCGGKGRDLLRGAGGNDLCSGGKGRDRGPACERGRL